MLRHFSLLIMTALFILVSCRKDDTHKLFALPDKTQSGQHTFGFRLNSAVWTNYGKMCFPFGSGCRENLRGYFQRSNGQIEIGADRVLHKEGVQNSREDIHLTLRTNFRGARSYSAIANDTIGFYYRSSERANQWQEKWYALPTINPDFTIVLTKVDTTQKILSGEFSGKLFRLDYMTNMIIPTDSIIITEGRFDLKLPY